MSDWFKPDKKTAPPAKPRLGMLRLVIFAMLAFWVFNKFLKPPAEADVPSLPPAGTAQDEPRGPRRSPTGEVGQLPQRDWELDGRDATDHGGRDAQPRGTAMPAAKPRQGNSDWSLEEVETKPSNADNEVRFDQRGPVKKSNATKTTKGDWSIEEVKKD